jgi:hypothetical protein
MFRNWIKRVFQARPISPRRARPSVEARKDRTTPSILSTPTSGLLHTATGGRPVLGGLEPRADFSDLLGGFHRVVNL